MSFSLQKVQDYRKVPGKNEVRLVGENPYLRFTNRDATPVYLQGGQFYDEGGNILELDDWVIVAVKRVRLDKLKRIGLDVDAFIEKHGPLDDVKPGIVVSDAETEQEVSEIRTPRKRR